ncbi:hypothetical protein [Pedobacter cryoconitis]|uniref:Uncharacterized protein n=1 Tax=Pedobacter cryoconitis TaxID=188932 RepID=A0A327SGC3_9SPHI|nr:hypothetical protein [Pedobacter cryoconitis]RAJ28116.1 hypothetical protein LY11_03436 [Pedobacter cryoconitis]
MKSKAIFLLVIFLLNTIVGFGCALGMDGNHNDEGHSHAQSTAHVHKDHDHHLAIGHEHKSAPVPGVNFSKQDLCCKTLVNDLVTQSKLVPGSSKVLVVLPVLWLPDYSYGLLIPETVLELDQSFCVDQRERPPNKDIRIVIQSFQI